MTAYIGTAPPAHEGPHEWECAKCRAALRKVMEVNFGWTEISEYRFIVSANSKDEALDKIEAYLRKAYNKEDADRIVAIMRHDKPARSPSWIFGASVNATHDEEDVIDVSYFE